MNLKELSLYEIKGLWNSSSDKEKEELVRSLKKDSRAGSRKVALQFEKKKQKDKEQEEEFYCLNNYERRLRNKGFKLIAGVDESGRGALAGPLVAAAVILPDNFFLPGVKDCKKLFPQKRRFLYDEIIKVAVIWKTAVIEPSVIDKIGVQKANIKALTTAVNGLNPRPDFILSDGFRLPQLLEEPHLSLIKGDTVSISIAAASIISKVTRDEIMSNYHKKYPFYKFNKHKGYGTSDHFLRIEKYGMTPIHRRSFLGMKEGSN